MKKENEVKQENLQELVEHIAKEEADLYNENILNVFYPVLTTDHHKEYPNASLLEFILYYPLIDQIEFVNVLEDVLQNNGGIVGGEEELYQKINALIDAIPDSPERRFVDRQAEEIRRMRFERTSPNKELISSDAFWEGQEDYTSKVESQKKLCKAIEEIMNTPTIQQDVIMSSAARTHERERDGGYK